MAYDIQCQSKRVARYPYGRITSPRIPDLLTIKNVGLKLPKNTKSIKSLENQFFRFVKSPKNEPARIDDLHTIARERVLEAKAILKNDNTNNARLILTSALRSARRQLGLYIQHAHSQYGGPDSLPANPPGKSLHHFGVAIDISLLNNADVKIKALEKAGWKQNKLPHDPVHFEITDATVVSNINQAIRDIKPYSDAIQKDVSDFLNIRKTYQELYIDYRNITKELSKTIKLSRQKATRLRKLRAEYIREKGHILSVSDKINARKESVEKLRISINNMVYTGCINGNPWNRCDHHEAKERWCNNKNNNTNKYMKESQAIAIKMREYEQRLNTLVNNMNEYNALVREYYRSIPRSDARIKRLRELRSRMSLMHRKLNISVKRIPKQVKKVQDLINATRKEA